MSLYLMHLILTLSALSIGCKQSIFGSSKVKQQEDDIQQINSGVNDFELLGRCEVIKLVTDQRYTQAMADQQRQVAQTRKKAAEIIWKAVAEERKRKNQAFAVDWTNDIQTSGYIEPMFLADIRTDLAFTGSNHWDYYQATVSATQREATEFARSVSNSTSKQLSVSEAFRLALSRRDHDPIKALSYLGALTIWDRWQAESAKSNIGNGGGGNRNSYTVIPQLIAPIATGDQSGQVYHFWGYAALALNGGFYKGQVSTIGYEGVLNAMKTGHPDMEDLGIDQRAMAFGIGIATEMDHVPSVDEAAEQSKKFLCGAEPSQLKNTNSTSDRSCQIWLGNASTKDIAKEQQKTLLAAKPTIYLNFDDVVQCSVKAKQAVSKYSYVKLADGNKPNFAMFRYGGEAKNPQFGFMSSAWIGGGIGRPKFSDQKTKLCIEANKIGGTCGALRQASLLQYGGGTQEEQTKFLQNYQNFIDYVVASNQYCLSLEASKCLPQMDADFTSKCMIANKQGGSCKELKELCSWLECSPSSADFSTCVKNHDFSVKSCLVANQHCIANQIDGCVALDQIEKYLSGATIGGEN